MSERSQVEEELGDAGVLDALRWARGSAYARTLQDFDPDTGHDQAWIGTSAYKLLVDRLDRVFACGKYAVGSDGEAEVGLDVVGSGLLPGELEAMPILAPGSVDRDDLNQSPGWRAGEWRWLLVSCAYGTWNRIPWNQKSETKRRVAVQPTPGQLMLAPDVLEVPRMLDAWAGLAAAVNPRASTTLILAHSVNADSDVGELRLGRPRMSEGGSSAWWWTIDLLLTPPPTTARTTSTPLDSGPASPESVPDASVRLRLDGDSKRNAHEGDKA